MPTVQVVHNVHTKEVGIAYALLVLLGGFGAHRFYLGRAGSAIGFLVLWQLGAWTWWTGLGLLFGGAAVVWFVIDLCVLPGMVREENQRRLRESMQMMSAYRLPR
jgi:TM2 domain-containing membrane protein YozV